MLKETNECTLFSKIIFWGVLIISIIRLTWLWLINNHYVRFFTRSVLILACGRWCVIQHALWGHTFVITKFYYRGCFRWSIQLWLRLNQFADKTEHALAYHVLFWPCSTSCWAWTSARISRFDTTIKTAVTAHNWTWSRWILKGLFGIREIVLSRKMC